MGECAWGNYLWKIRNDSDGEGYNVSFTFKLDEKVQDELFRLELNGFVQELSSAKKDFIPSFDLTGVERREDGE